MLRKLVSFNPSDAYAIVESYSAEAGIQIPYQAINEVVIYLVENMDKNMAYTSSFWTQAAISKFATATNTMPNFTRLTAEQLNLVMIMLQPLGFALYGTIYHNQLFIDGGRDSFPYIVRSANNGLVVLEEDAS